MSKLKVALIFGGRSAEHEVSIRSARSIAQALDKSKYEVVPVAIDRTGVWHLEDAQKYLLPDVKFPIEVEQKSGEVVPAFASPSDGKQSFDVAFPITHGPFGEDGSLQGLLRLAGIPFVGPSVLGSAVGMDKDVMKRLFRDAGLGISKFVAIQKQHAERANYEEIAGELGKTLFIKPANMGSSVGISKVESAKDFTAALQAAFQFDTKVIVEENIKGREIEVSVLGNESLQASIPGEIRPRKSFYSYEAKYLDDDGAELIIPAELSKDQIKEVQSLAIKAFEALCCEGMGRVDFFLTDDGRFLINEINTLPGFTSISMYPKLWEESGLPFPKLLDELISLAIKRQNRDSLLKISPED